MKTGRLWIAAAAALAALAVADVGLSIFALRDGELLGREVPPYGDVAHRRWRPWLRAQHERLAHPDEARITRDYDPELGWTHRAPEGTLSVRFNALGARASREYSETPEAGHVRLAVFGESFVFCEEVAERDSFEAQLETLDPRVEALNFGVDGYGTDQALMRFRRDGLAPHAQVLAIGLMLENIGRNVNRFPRLWNPWLKNLSAKPRMLLDHGALTVLPPPFASRAELVAAVEDGSMPERLREHEAWAEPPLDSPLWCSSLYRIGRARWSAAQRFHPTLWAEPDGEPFRVTLAILEAFAREAKAAGARHAVVLIFPAKEDLDRLAKGEPPYWTTLTDALRERGIEFVDLAGALGAAARAQPQSKFFLRAHLGREGNGVVARKLLEWLLAPERSGLFGS